MPDAELLRLDSKLDLLVFDLDGTLIDSTRDLANSVNATLEFLSYPPLHDTHIASFVGDGVAILVKRALDAAGAGTAAETLMPRALPFFLTYYRAHKLDFTYAYLGVLETLQRIHEASPHLPMAVLTNKPVLASRSICFGLGLSPFFFQIYGGNSFDTKKPHPAGMHALMREAGALLARTISPAQVILVGDSHVDVQTARTAGVRCLGCTYGLDTEGLLAAKPDAIAASPAEWISALSQIVT